jgi:hypothetical protein
MFIELVDRPRLGAGKLHGLGDYRVKYGLEVKVELTAWLTSPSARSSSTERQLRRAIAQLLSSPVFSMAMTAWAANFAQRNLLVSKWPNPAGR